MNIYKIFLSVFLTTLICNPIFSYKPVYISDEKLKETVRLVDNGVNEEDFESIISVLKSKLLTDHDNLKNEDNEVVNLFKKLLKTDYADQTIKQISEYVVRLKKVGTIPENNIENIEDLLKASKDYKKDVFSKKDLQKEVSKLKRIFKRANNVMNKIERMINSSTLLPVGLDE